MNRLATLLRHGAVAILSALSLLSLFVGLYESWFTVILPDSERIASYHFGSEAMVGEGGWTYLNPVVYGWTALISGTLGAVALAAVALGLGRRSWPAATAGVVMLLVLFILWERLGTVQWERRATHGQPAAAS